MTVMGVMPAGFRFRYDVDLWSPPWPGNSDPITRRYHNWLLVGRLSEGVSLDAARSEIDVISAQLEEAYPESNQTKALQLDGLREAMVEGYRPSLLILIGAIVLVLLIACSNVASLLLARGSTRTSEMALRAALGAGRTRLTRQLLVECLILALVAGGMGVVLAVWLQDLILGFVSMDLLGLNEVGLSSSMLGTALALSLGTVLLFGIIPSLMTARANPAEDLKEGTRGSTAGGGMRFRSGLVVLQVALSLVLLVGSGLLMRSFAQLRGVDPGFRVENLLTGTVSLPAGRYTEVGEQNPVLPNPQGEHRGAAWGGVGSHDQPATHPSSLRERGDLGAREASGIQHGHTLGRSAYRPPWILPDHGHTHRGRAGSGGNGRCRIPHRSSS